MLNRTLTYGLGSHETDKIMRFTNLLSNMINTLYYPMEHLAWAGDQGVLPLGKVAFWEFNVLLTNTMITNLDSKPFWKGVSYCWASTMYLAIVRYQQLIYPTCLLNYSNTSCAGLFGLFPP